MNVNKNIYIMGIRGIPAQHGGFETFAEKLALYLTKRGWSVTVLCQEDGGGDVWESHWQNIRLIHVPVKYDGSVGTVLFDLKSILLSRERGVLFLTLGYNTAIFNVIQRFRGQKNVINMDGIEWLRKKWGLAARTWFWFNERIGCYVGNHLIADHPSIESHLSRLVSNKKITMIPYGGEKIEKANVALLNSYGIKPGEYSIIIARPEPENSIFEMVKAFSSRNRDHKLIVLGAFDPTKNPYHKSVVEAASQEVIFLGALYENSVINALRYFCCLYLHGHQVGGTNPSLVEALGASCAVVAHDNCFNRWVAGPSAKYFKNVDDCACLLDTVLENEKELYRMKQGSWKRFNENFTWDKVLLNYEKLLLEWVPKN
ncbi:MAG: DUF1972 domain-containing protein [Halomonas sp.]|nr:DUF1972 domain-containing protein [Halomonas sp.]